MRGFEGFCSVSSLGRVRSLRRQGSRGGLLSPVLRGGAGRVGYPSVVLRRPGVRRDALVHRLVAEAFLPPPLPGQTEVLHGPGGPLDASVANLRWGTRLENLREVEICWRDALADEEPEPLADPVPTEELEEAPF